MMKNETVFLIVVAVLSVQVQAVTIFETFDTDPLTRGWTMTDNGPTYATYRSDYTGDEDYVGGGHLMWTSYREVAENCDRYTTSLGQTFDQTQQFWMSFDMTGVWHQQYERAQFGVFNTTSPDIETNAIVTKFFRQDSSSTTGSLKTTARLYSYSDTGDETGPLWDDYAYAYGDVVRTNIHYWYDDDTQQGMASFEVWVLNAAGPEDDVLVSTGSGVLVPAGTTIEFDSFGLSNRQWSSAASLAERTLIDNLYFSTEGANSEYVDPAFVVIPEPATVALLGLGMCGLKLSKKRRK